MGNIVEVRDIHKSFKVYSDKGPSLKERIIFRKRNKYTVHQVLDGINLDIPKGQAVGLIGQNGSGKSTLLKLLTRIIYPDSGSIKIGGKVSSLLELGAGFHPDMTGRENIYINASIFGLTKKEIDARLDRIIEFSNLGKFIDNAVRTYSSGMYMRLAFSVAINVDADVLLIDEILAVGDGAFQAKCFEKLLEIKRAGTTIVIVSHSLDQIEKICDRTIWLREGQFYMDGTPEEVHPKYLEFMGSGGDRIERTDSNRNNRWGSGEVVFENVDMVGQGGLPKSMFDRNEAVNIVMQFNSRRKLKNVVAGFGIYRDDGLYVYGSNMLIDNAELPTLEGLGTITCRIPQLNLVSGVYKLQVALHTPEGTPFDYWKEQQTFVVNSNKCDEGVAAIEHTWEIK